MYHLELFKTLNFAHTVA